MAGDINMCYFTVRSTWWPATDVQIKNVYKMRTSVDGPSYTVATETSLLLSKRFWHRLLLLCTSWSYLSPGGSHTILSHLDVPGSNGLPWTSHRCTFRNRRKETVWKYDLQIYGMCQGHNYVMTYPTQVLYNKDTTTLHAEKCKH